MRLKNTLFVIAAAVIPCFAHGQINNDYRTTNSGIWDLGANWERWRNASNAWIVPSQSPDRGYPRATVRSGYDIVFGSTYNGSGGAPQTLGRTFVEAGATLKSNADSVHEIQLYADSLLVNGSFGGSGTDGWIKLEMYGGSLNFATHNLITGAGSINVLSLFVGASGAVSNQYPLVTPDTVIIDDDILIRGGMYSGFRNAASNISTDGSLMIINAGKTVTMTDTSGFHLKSSTTPYTHGNIVYQINGTLDMSAATGKSNVIPNSLNPLSLVTVNVIGKMMLGQNFNTINSAPSAANNGSVKLYIGPNGVVNAVSTALGNQVTGSPWITGGGRFRRIVGTTDTLFPIRTTTSVNNSISLKSLGTTPDTFSVNVRNGYSASWPATANLVNREWSINKSSSANGLLTGSVYWTAADQNTGFSATAPVSLYVYTGNHWKEVSANVSVSGAGTAASPYKATAAGLDSAKLIVVGNAGVALPAGTGVGVKM